MRVLIVTFGTRGDVEIFLSLGAALAGLGHTVTLGSSPFYEPLVAQRGLDWLPLGHGTQLELIEIVRSLGTIAEKRERIYRYAQCWIRPQLTVAMPALKKAISDCDYFINNMRSLWQRGNRVVPGAEVTYDPPADIYRLDEYPSHRPENAAAILQLVAMNRALVDPAGVWPESYNFTGFWQPAASKDAAIPSPLLRFVESDEPPIVLTMGSMVMFDRDAMLTAFAEALAMLGRRGVAITSWAGDAPETLRWPHLYMSAEIPYSWLFPHAACVLHHGGCGTVGMALRAGTPSVLFPQISSQEHFAQLMARQNLLGGALDCQHPSAVQMAAAIVRATADDVRQSTKTWQQRIADDPGVSMATELIADHASCCGIE